MNIPTPDQFVAGMDKFYREQAKDHNTQYLGYDNKGDFVVYKFREPDGTLQLRCDNFHFHRQGVSAVRLIDAIEVQQANFDIVRLEEDRMLTECRLRWNEMIASGALRKQPPDDAAGSEG
jgi:hypothetical protein